MMEVVSRVFCSENISLFGQCHMMYKRYDKFVIIVIQKLIQKLNESNIEQA